MDSAFDFRLLPEHLSKKCDPGSFAFTTTDELPELEDVVGQPRAFQALQLGSELKGSGFNIFVLGLPGSGKLTLSRQYLERKAKKQPAPPDWCYAYNFKNPHHPKAISLPAGQAAALREDLKNLILQAQKQIFNAFESKEYTYQKEKIAEKLNQQQEVELSQLQQLVSQHNFLLIKAPFGFVIVPAKNGKPLEAQDIENLPPEKHQELDDLRLQFNAESQKTVEKLRQMEQEAYKEVHSLDEKTAAFILEPLVSHLVKKYQDISGVVEHLNALQADIIENLETFRQEEDHGLSREDLLKRYDLNILVNNQDQKGAPVITENQPSYSNLLGRIDHEIVMGVTRTNFTLISPGALHRANGGYLLIPARDLLLSPYAWEGLKRTLREEAIRIISLEMQYGLSGTSTMEPEAIPLNVKIVLIGTPLLYYLLQENDEDFEKLFKIRSEFACTMDRTKDTEYEYALFVKSVVQKNGLLPFHRSAVAKIIDQGSWLVDDQQKLSTRFGKIADLIQEAAYWAGSHDHPIVTAEDVEYAIQKSTFRNNLMEERIHQAIARETILINTTHSVAGQINALSVISIGDNQFGFPSRITVSVSPGSAGIIDIENEASLGGPIHTKGLLIVSGILRERYGKSKPINLSASITFEQSYGGVEGDSASAAEVIALLSAISGVPIQQSVAITGSVNQKGEMQAVGGVNQKIEGFFTICAQKELTGSQGVIIPWSNRHNLMLTQQVVDAVASGKFHIWAVKTLDQAIEQITGMESGAPIDKGEKYPPGTFNYLVNEKIVEFNQSLKEQEAAKKA
ncbi:MAG: AAA family ATPase [Chloroflexi bacterium]|nr:AAA family ATPase [Chloroflexota bacterium]